MSKAEALRQGTEEVARGELELESEAAKRKIGMFSLPDPHFWVLQLVRAACVLGASRVEFEVSSHRVTATFDAALDARLLKSFWNTALRERTSPQHFAVYYLALAMSAVAAFEPSSLSVTSDGGTLWFTKGDVVFQPGAASRETVVDMIENIRPAHLLEYFRTFFDEPAEINALRHYACFGPIEVIANGSKVHRQDLKMLSPNTRGAFTLDEQLATVILRHGVKVWERSMLFDPIGGILVRDDESLRLDLSTMSVTGVPSALLAELRDQYLALIAEVEDPDFLKYTHIQRALLNHLAPVTYGLERFEGSMAQRLLMRLSEEPVFTRAIGRESRQYSLNSARKDDAIEYSTERMPTLRAAEYAHVLHLDRNIAGRLARLGVKLRKMTHELDATRRGVANRERWKRQPKRLSPAGTAVCTVDEFYGWVEIAAGGAGSIEFCIDRRTVRVDALRIPCRIVVNGPFATTPAFDEVIVGEEVRPLVRMLMAQIRAKGSSLLAEGVTADRLEQEVYGAFQLSPPARPVPELPPSEPPEELSEPEPVAGTTDATPPLRTMGSELESVIHSLSEARSGHRELIGDHFLRAAELAEGSKPFTADDAGLTLGEDHPFASKLHSPDPIVISFLASCAATAINAYYRSFTDDDEIRLQHSLLRRTRDDDPRWTRSADDTSM